MSHVIESQQSTSNSEQPNQTIQAKQVAQSFKKLYQNLTIENIDSIRAVYAKDATFEDPFQCISGIDQLVEYFQLMYQNVSMISFDFEQVSIANSSFHINWTMNLVHPKLNKGQLLSVKGCSFIRFNEQAMINYHRDYFDAGAMLYEQLPVLKQVIKKIKQQF